LKAVWSLWSLIQWKKDAKIKADIVAKEQSSSRDFYSITVIESAYFSRDVFSKVKAWSWRLISLFIGSTMAFCMLMSGNVECLPSREVGALLDTAAEVPSGIVLSVDKIDDDRTDTFRPSVSDKAEAGTTSEALCLKSPLKEMQTCSVIAEPSVSNMLTYFVTPSALPAQLTPFQ
jgi:hypothetical protein